MSETAVDVTGYELARAREICASASVEVSEVVRIGPSDDRCEGRREIVTRQRVDDRGGAELTVSRVWVTPEGRER